MPSQSASQAVLVGRRLPSLSGFRRQLLGDVAGVLLAVLVIGAPGIFTRNGFALDFTNHLWLVFVQEQAISAHLTPTYFLNASIVGVFYPFFMFYGGSLYAAAGALAALLGDHVGTAYIGFSLLSVAAAYGGCLWLSRQLGVRSWLAHAPAITFVASAYYVTDLYGRGAWPEFVATSMIPLMAASGWSLFRSERLRPLPVVLLVVSTALFAGSHNVTLALGSLVMAAALLFLWIALGAARVPARRWRRIAEIAGLLVLSVALDGWFLVPDVLHASTTQVGSQAILPAAATGFFDTPAVLFNPLRSVPKASSTPALFVQAPDWLLLWALVSGAILWRGAGRRLRRAGQAVVLLLVAILVMIMSGPVWNAMPKIVREAQFPYRMNTYLALGVAGLVLICACALADTRSARTYRALTVGLAGAVAVSVGLCVWQLWVPNTRFPLSYTNRNNALVSTHVAPRTWYSTVDYDDIAQPLVAPTGSLPISPEVIDSSHVRLTVTPPPGNSTFGTNIAAGPWAATLGGGWRRVGRNPIGWAVARRTVPGSGPVTVTLATAGGAITAGQIVTLAAAAVLLLILANAIRRGIKSRKRAQ